jgi:hypothetical protein
VDRLSDRERRHLHRHRFPPPQHLNELADRQCTLMAAVTPVVRYAVSVNDDQGALAAMGRAANQG